MKIAILTYGSRGDVQPFVALARRLRQSGHSPLLAAPGRFSNFAARFNVDFVSLPGEPEEISRALNDSGANLLRIFRVLQGYTQQIAPQVVVQMLEICSQADFIVHSFLFTVGAHALARSLGAPELSVQGFPVFIPTGEFPNVAFPPLGRFGNLLSHHFANQMFWWGSKIGFMRIRSRLPGNFPAQLTWPFRASRNHPPAPLLIAVSPSVLSRPAEWPQTVHMPGYFFLDEDTYQPPQELIRFLEAGATPLCVTFGSMLHRAAPRIFRTLLQAIEARNERVIILAGWNDPSLLKESEANERILILPSAPHEWLFPRCKFVVHHGGAGTTAAVLHAGVPQIVLPHTADQPFWGRRVHALGVAPAPIPIGALSMERVLASFSEAESASLQAAAKSLSARIRAEDGVGYAVQLIEQLAK
jgi:sterol 3beta-glucosyltransferase